MRGVRPVPAALPDVPRDGGGGPLAPWTHRCDARRPVARRAPADGEFVRFMETCVQCRGCEPACPSGVPFGHLMEGTREALADDHRTAPRLLRAGFGVLGRHRALLAGSTLLAAAQRLRLVPRRAGLARLPLRRGRRVADSPTASADHVWLYTGCVMDAWMRDTHHATAALLAAAGATWSVSPDGCCGALHAHAGLGDSARDLAAAVIRSMPGDAPIVVNSAGCGAAMKDYGHLLGTPEAAGVRGARGRRAGVARPAHRPAAAAAHAARPGDRPGPVPPPSRAAGPRAGARRRGPRRRRRRARRRGAVLRSRWRLLGAATGARRRDPRPQGRRHRSRHGPAPARASWPAPTPAARCTSRPPG